MAEVFYNHLSELATVSNTFSVAGVATDPTTVTLVVTDPAGVPDTFTQAGGDFTHTPATGAYSINIPCTSTVPGVWTAVWIGTGAASDVATVTWTTVPTEQASLYCTPEMLKGRKGITDTHDDVEILGACRAVSRWIDRKYCQRFFYRQTATKTFTATDLYCLPVPDLVGITTLKTDVDGDGTYETTWATGDRQLLPVNAAVELEPGPYTEIAAVGALTFPVVYGAPGSRTNRVQVEGVWGWPEVPEPVREAAKILAGDYLKLGGMAFGVAGYGDYGAVRARMSSPALEMLDAYRLHPVLMG